MSGCMKKMIFLPVLAFVLAICFQMMPAGAQDMQSSLPALDPLPTLVGVQSPKPAQSSPFTIALTYYKLTARLPDFEAWVKQ